MSNRYSKILLIAVTIICFIFMAVSYIDSQALGAVKSCANYLLVPIQKSISNFGQAAAAGIDENIHLHEVYNENEQLRAQVDALTSENNRLKNETGELDRLRELYALDREYQQYPTVAARVISSDSLKWFNVFRIDKGLADGITKDMNVLGGGGLIGIVVDVGPNYSTVRTIVDEDSNVYGMSQYSGDACLVKGNITSYESGLIDISNIDKNAVINNGDAIVTSDLSTKFLPGILIGYASDIKINSQHLTKSGKLIPAADFTKIREVLIVTQLKTDTGIVSMDVSSGRDGSDLADILPNESTSAESETAETVAAAVDGDNAVDAALADTAQEDTTSGEE